jgi:hypothetical protein
MDEYHSVRRDILSELPGYNPEFEIIHYAYWADYEESGYMFILRHYGQLYSLHNGYCVMSDDNIDCWDPHPITEDRAIELIIEWDEIEEHNRNTFAG